MDQQNKAKPEENQNKPAELSDKDLNKVAGGGTLAGVTLPDKAEVKGNVYKVDPDHSGVN